jgi:hypothetical protein
MNTSGQNAADTVPSPTEFLKHVLQTYYNGPDEDPFLWSLSYAAAERQELLRRHPITAHDGTSESHRQAFLERLRQNNSFKLSLRPLVDETPNVLGDVWKTVLAMTRDDYPYFSEVAVGIAKVNLISGRVFRHPNGVMAIVLGFAGFNDLYGINHMMALTLRPQLFSPRKLDLIRTLVHMLAKISHHFGKKTLPRSRMPYPTYETMDELGMVHEWTFCQQVFILLHEFGHVVQMHAPSAHLVAEACTGSSELELAADRWAAGILKAKGDKHCPLIAQLNSLFWLCEYMHFIEVCEDQKSACNQLARSRFDTILSVIDPISHIIPAHYINDTRNDLDEVYRHWPLFLELLADAH